MGVSIIEIENKYFRQLTNGATFGDNLTDFTPNLVGSVGNKIKVAKKLWLSYGSAPTKYSTWSYTHLGSNAYIITRQTGSFITDGLSVGDTIYWDNDVINPAASPNNNGVITSIDALNVIVTFTGSNGTSGVELYYGTIHGTSSITALIYKFGLIGNNDVFSIANQITGNDQGYYLAGITSSFQPMEKLGLYSDWVTGSARIKKNTNPSTYVQEFEIEHIFEIPFYKEEEESNIKLGILPSNYSGDNSIKYVYECDFRNAISNPDSSRIKRMEQSKGSVAYYNENFNGFKKDYELKSITYTDTVTTNQVDAIQLYNSTTVEMVFTGSFNIGDNIVGYFSYLPTGEQYTNTLTTFNENFINESLVYAIDSAAVVGNRIKLLQAIPNIGGELVVTMIIELSQADKLLCYESQLYNIAIELGDCSLSAGNINSVVINVADNFALSSDIYGLVSYNDLEIYKHYEDINALNYTQSKTDNTVWIEDTLYNRFSFSIDLSKQAFINSFNFLLIAENTITGSYFSIEKFPIIVSDSPIVAGVQQININKVREYPFYNEIIIQTGAKVGDDQYYTILFPQKIFWQEWLNQNDADTIFYDNSKPNKGLNKKSSNYSGINDYQIKVGLMVNVSGVDELGKAGTTDYLLTTNNITVNDYNVNNGIVGVINTYKKTGELIGTGILSDDDTVLKATFEKAVPWTLATEFWGQPKIEQYQQNGVDLQEQSTVNQLTAGILKPFSGELFARKEIIDGKIVVSCLIDKNKVSPNTQYALSCRINDGMFLNVPKCAILKEDGSGYYMLEDGIGYVLKEDCSDDILCYSYNYFAVETNKLAPTGYRVATESDFNDLISLYPTNPTPLRNTGTYPNEYNGWALGGGSDIVGFNAMPINAPTGYVYQNNHTQGSFAQYWMGDVLKWQILQFNTYATFGALKYWDGKIRCCRDASPTELLLNDGSYIETITDLDGNEYICKKIGSLVWFTQDLMTTKYNDGVAIEQKQSNTSWTNSTTAAYRITDL